MEQHRSSLHRVGPVALTALGIFGAVLMIFAGLMALNRTVLPFDGWPNGIPLSTGKQILPRAPAESGRLRTASGGTLAGITDGQVTLPGLTGAAASSVVTSVPRLQSHFRLRLRPQHARSHSSLPTVGSKPAAPVVAPVVAQPVPVAPAPVVSSPVVIHGHAYGRRKHAVSAPAPTTAPVSKAPAPAAPVPAVAATATPVAQDEGPGNGHGRGHAYGHDQAAPGNGPPPWANGRGKHS